MGLCNSPDIFQEKMSELFISLDTVRVYIDDLLHVTKGSWTDHVSILKEMLTRLQKAGLKVNASKSFFGAHKFDYLGYHVTSEGVMPIPKKVEAIQALAVPKTCKQLRQFIGMINFYRDMWQKRSELLAPLTALTSKFFKYDWKDEHQKCFEASVRISSGALKSGQPNNTSRPITRLIASKQFWCSSFQSYLTLLEVKAGNGARSSERFYHMSR